MTHGDLISDLLEYDGNSTSILSQTRELYGTDPNFLADLIALVADSRSNLSDGASWILKAELEEGTELSDDLTEKLIASLNEIVSWPTILHILQISDHLPLTEDQTKQMVKWAENYTHHNRPFLRAWSYHTIITLGRRLPDLQGKSNAALVKAQKDPAASVRTRARNLAGSA